MSKEYKCAKCKIQCKSDQAYGNVTDHVKSLLILHNIQYNNEANVRIHKRCIQQLQREQLDMKVSSIVFHAYIITI